MEISLDLNLSAPSLLVATTWCPVFKVSTTTELRIVSGTEYEMAISDSRATSKEASFSRALGSIKSKSPDNERSSVKNAKNQNHKISK